MSRDQIRIAKSHWIFFNPGVHTFNSYCNSIVGIVLDQLRRYSSQSIVRITYSIDYDYAIDISKSIPSKSFLYQGNRRLDVGMFDIRVYCLTGIRVCQRNFTEQIWSGEKGFSKTNV